MDFLPLFHRTIGKRCLIIGGGVIASRRAKVLAKADLCVDVIAPHVSSDLVSLVKKTGGSVLNAEFNQDDFSNREWHKYFLIIAATNVRDVNAQVCRLAKANSIPVNVVDMSQESDFIFPAIIARDSITVAISNNGSSPVLSRLLKERVDAYLPTRYGQLSCFVGKYREQVKEALPDVKERIRFWEGVLQGSIAEHVFADNQALAENELIKDLEAVVKGNPVGEAYLIDVGPGDVELLTLRAFRLLQQSEVVLYDHSLSKEVRALITVNCEHIFIDVTLENHRKCSVDKLISIVKQNKRVARLFTSESRISIDENKYVDALLKEDIPFIAVPGVQSAPQNI